MRGVFGVLVAFYIVKELLSIDKLRWLIIVVVTYAAVSMLRSAFAPRVAAPAL